MTDEIIIIKGAGDIASAVAHKLFRSGFNVIMTEVDKPTCLRRYVSFANCIYQGEWQVEGVKGKKADNVNEALQLIEAGYIAVLVDEKCNIKRKVKTPILIDGILAKTNTGTTIGDAPLVIGLGPGFTAGDDVDMVIETNRGHNLGKVILKGGAENDTGVPGYIMGVSKERVLRSSYRGKITHSKKLGDIVRAGEVVAMIGNYQIKAKISGVIRGLIYEELYVEEGTKIGDIDPRGYKDLVYTISDKGRCIAGGVLEAIMMWNNHNRGCSSFQNSVGGDHEATKRGR